MLLWYRIKWLFHCGLNLHRQLTIYTAEETMVGCYECNLVNDQHGNTYVPRKT